MEHEYAQVGLLRSEALLDPGIAPPADHAVVEIGLGGVDGHDRHPVAMQLRAALAEELLEVDVAHVARVVVARDHDHPLAGDAVEIVARELVLAPQALAGQVAGHDHQVGLELVDLHQRAVEQAGHEEGRPAVGVGQVGDGEGGGAHTTSRRSSAASRRSGPADPSRSAACTARKSRAAATSCTRRMARAAVHGEAQRRQRAGVAPGGRAARSARRRSPCATRPPAAAGPARPARAGGAAARSTRPGSCPGRGRDRGSAPSSPTPRSRASAMRSSRNSRTSATTSLVVGKALDLGRARACG